MIKTILFNLNATLINTLRADQISKKSIMEKHGRQFDETFHEINHGDEDLVYWDKYIKENGLSLNRDDLTSESSKLYNSYALHYNKLYPGTQELIERCKSNNIKIGVCTNSQRKRTIQSLSSFGMEGDFEHIVTREDVSEGKPSSESYTLLAEKLESELDDTCVILENTPTGLAAAIQTGATVVQVDHASNQPKIKEATHYITDWSQLIHIFS